MDEVLIYGELWEYPARVFHESLNALSGDALTVRLNTPGGDVYIGWGMVAMFSEFPGEKKVKIDGRADSMGFYFLCYVDYAEAVDVCGSRVHRAALPDWYETSDYFTDVDRASLKQVNDNLRAALSAKVPDALFTEVTGYTYNDLFSMEGRLEIQLTAKQLKKLGLVNKITQLTPTKTKAISTRMAAIAASFPDRITGNIPEPVEIPVLPKEQPTVPAAILKELPKHINNMTLEEIKAQNPSVFAQIIAMGVTQEQDRVRSWTAFHSIDAVAVLDGINSGVAVTPGVISEMSVKSFNAAGLSALSTEKSPVVETPEAVSKVTADPELAAFTTSVKSNFNLKS